MVERSPIDSSRPTCQLLEELLQRAVIRPIDKAFGVFLAELSEKNEIDWVAVIGAIASQQLGQQHTCIDLQELQFNWSPYILLPPYESLLEIISADERICVVPDTQVKPLMLHGSLVYLQKYWQYEDELVQRLTFFAGKSSAWDENGLVRLKEDLKEVFPQTSDTASEIDWQKVAVALAAIKPFCVITGGPGTGKTTTVAKLLWLLTKQQKGTSFVVKLAAPTGKAAARLTESLRSASEKLPSIEGIDLPEECTTIHRLLGVKRFSPEFQHNPKNPLRLDLLIVDEASMIDLPLLSKLFAAIPDHARVVLLGDNNQLASVEVGSVLGDLCSVKQHWESYDAITSQLLNKIAEERLEIDHQPKALSVNLVFLQKSYRFDAQSGIGQLANAVNSGVVGSVFKVLGYDNFNDISWTENLEYAHLISQTIQHWKNYFNVAQKGEAETVFSLLSQMQILCMQRAGPWGIEALNQLLEHHFIQQGLVDARTEYYAGRPIMIVENDHRLGLFNGDIGVVLPNLLANTKALPNYNLLRVWFRRADGTFKHFLSGQLPKHETVYAMTTHKSQGSEFDKVILCMPGPETEQQKSLLSRELFYTGVTRAKKEFVLMAEKTAINHAVNRRCLRASGLTERLHQLD